jgi:hypothetical protein
MSSLQHYKKNRLYFYFTVQVRNAERQNVKIQSADTKCRHMYVTPDGG